LTHFSGWLTGPGDGSMGPSLRVMNSMCVYIYHSSHGRSDIIYTRCWCGSNINES
jgi:hypothetical protein